MAATYMLRKHQATMAAARKPEAIEERRAYNAAVEKARADRSAKFPQITPDNFEEAAAYQDERIAYWRTAIARA